MARMHSAFATLAREAQQWSAESGRQAPEAVQPSRVHRLTGLSEGPLLERARRLPFTSILLKGKAKQQDIIDAVSQGLRHYVAH